MLDLRALEEQARAKLDRGVYDFYAGGADDELTLGANVAAWSDLSLRPRVLRDVSAVTVRTTVLGLPLSFPVLVAPVAHQRMAHPDGELAMARGAAAAGSLMVVSTRSSTPLEDVATCTGDAPLWFQLYVLRDRSWTADLVDRAREAGYRALVITVDTPVVGRHLRELRDDFARPADFGMANMPPDVAGRDPTRRDLRTRSEQTPDLTFADIGWLAERSRLPVVAKGVLRGDDAVACLDAGASAVIVSNHGGRQLDGAVATARALPDVVDAVAGRAEVYVDGGIRRGSDILRALALGARAVLIGRPALWGLATRGAGGVRDVLDQLRLELELAMALCGTPDLASVTPDLIVS